MYTCEIKLLFATFRCLVIGPEQWNLIWAGGEVILLIDLFFSMFKYLAVGLGQ